jgi:hypothetical protein
MLKGQEVTGVKVIEMNRFNETTGGGLFDWDNDQDVLFGRKPFEFRVLEKPAMQPQHFQYWIARDFKDIRKVCRETILNERHSKKE